MDAELAATLAEMAAEDERIRRLPEGEPLTFVRRVDPETAKQWERADADHAKRLGAILARHGRGDR
jgi:hypothetical protein